MLSSRSKNFVPAALLSAGENEYSTHYIFCQQIFYFFLKIFHFFSIFFVFTFRAENGGLTDGCPPARADALELRIVPYGGVRK